MIVKESVAGMASARFGLSPAPFKENSRTRAGGWVGTEPGIGGGVSEGKGEFGEVIRDGPQSISSGDVLFALSSEDNSLGLLTVTVEYSDAACHEFEEPNPLYFPITRIAISVEFRELNANSR
jgi:hypothetical protein